MVREYSVCVLQAERNAALEKVDQVTTQLNEKDQQAIALQVCPEPPILNTVSNNS